MNSLFSIKRKPSLKPLGVKVSIPEVRPVIPDHLPPKQKLKNLPDPHKRLIDNLQQLTLVRNKKEKIEIDCESTTSEKIMSKSLINFNDNFDDSRVLESENIFNNLVRNQIMEEYNEVNEFLNEIKMEKYVDLFIQNGWVGYDIIIGMG
jgi:hypothetical protein